MNTYHLFLEGIHGVVQRPSFILTSPLWVNPCVKWVSDWILNSRLWKVKKNVRCCSPSSDGGGFRCCSTTRQPLCIRPYRIMTAPVSFRISQQLPYCMSCRRKKLQMGSLTLMNQHKFTNFNYFHFSETSRLNNWDWNFILGLRNRSWQHLMTVHLKALLELLIKF